MALRQRAERWARLARKAAVQDTTLDVKGIIWLEHINIVVGNRDLAEIFYFQGLGLTRDPKDTGSTMWANVGPRQQFHLAKASDVDPAQKLFGSIGLALPNLRALVARLESVAGPLRATSFAFEDFGDVVAVMCPWGNQFFVYCSKAEINGCTESPPLKVRRTTTMQKAHTYIDQGMGVRGEPGIRFVQLACCSPEGVGRFYKDTFGCCAFHEGSGDVAVCVGPSVHLIFSSHEDGFTELERSKRAEQARGIHICVYISDFKQSYETLQKAGAIWTNPRFVSLDVCDTFEEAAASRQYRFRSIRDPSTGEELVELEHETRSLRHVQFMKEVIYSSL